MILSIGDITDNKTIMIAGLACLGLGIAFYKLKMEERINKWWDAINSGMKGGGSGI